MPRAIREILPHAVPRLAEPLAEIRMRESWDAVVGSAVARRARPGPLADGCLTVVVDNSPWLHELRLRQGEVLAMIQRQHAAVRSLRLTLGPLPDSPRDQAGPTTRRPVPLSAQDQLEIEQATAAISDAALAAAARRLLARARQVGTAP